MQPAELGNRKTLGGNTNMNATYFAFHIRRGDFQYKDTQISAERIWSNARPLLDPAVSNLIYIATDEKDKGSLRPTPLLPLFLLTLTRSQRFSSPFWIRVSSRCASWRTTPVEWRPLTAQAAGSCAT